MAFTTQQATAAIEGLASRGMVIGEERRTTGGGGTYAHHDPAVPPSSSGLEIRSSTPGKGLPAAPGCA